MIDRQQLLKGLQRELPKLEKDILAYSEQSAERTAHLKQEYAKAKEAGRTAEHFVSWREAQITQAAVAWVLTCVFVRFLEDNGLLAQPVLSGPVERESGPNSAKSHPLKNAKDRIEAYFNEHPTYAEREYLLHLFEQLEQFPVIAELLDHRHNPLWQIPVSADGAKSLIDFFQKIDPETGQIIHDFTDPDWDTRFLGDLYQDLSEAVRKRYALLQTPEFVENFILDYTLEPAIKTFGLEGLRLIDPTCGSGHFLLTTFERIFERWQKREPGTNTRVLAQRALDVVHGVDINPYAIAICRFRLLMAAMKDCNIELIKDAPAFHFNLACGDSLLHGKRFEWQGQGLQQGLLDDEFKHVFESEDIEKLNKILGHKQYHVVVGNPPYITVKDKGSRESIRKRYFTCSGKYSLGVPFTERFFELAHSLKNGKAGYVGMITANSFIKRDFGKILIEKYLPSKDLTNLIDASGFNFAGHGTPTIIMYGRNQPPVSHEVCTVISSVADSSSNECIETGDAWKDILKNFTNPGFSSAFIHTENKPRSFFDAHPWSLVAGINAELLENIEKNCTRRLEKYSSAIGPATFPGLDDTFLWPEQALSRYLGVNKVTRRFIYGESVRNWGIASNIEALVPYDEDQMILPEARNDLWYRVLWPYRSNLENLIGFGSKKRKDTETLWWEWYRWIKARLISPLSITFPFVATHNHFVLDRGGNVFKQTAPVIKLPDGSSEADHLALLGLLNSSIACFWGRQVFFSKRGEDVGKWGEFMEFDGTKLKRLPIPDPIESHVNDERLLSGYKSIESYAGKIDAFAQQLSICLPESVVSQLPSTTTTEELEAALTTAMQQAKSLRNKMVALQEELDWLCYQAYGLINEALIFQEELPEINPGERAFETLLARDIAENGISDAWFTRHQQKQTQVIPSCWPKNYQQLVEQRMTIIKSERYIKLMEKPEYKRRWLPLEWEKQEQDVLRRHLLETLEQDFSTQNPTLSTCAQLSERIQKNPLANAIAQRYTGNEFYDAQKLANQLIATEHVPQTAANRLKTSAIKKYRAWQEIWDKQRQEDLIDQELGVDHPLSEVDKSDSEKAAAHEKAKQLAKTKKAELIDEIPIPPKYVAGDFSKASYWQLRGKLDVPKERFFSLPGCEKDGDNTLVIGWAGLNHLQRAQAIAAWYEDRKENDGWEAERLMPMLVAIDELIPWLKQWHNDIDPEYGERMGDFYESYLLEELRRWELTREELLNWRPPTTTRKRR